MNEAFIRQAVEEADPNALRLALYQATDDASLLDMEIEKVPLRGGAIVHAVVAEKHVDALKEKAVRFLVDDFEDTEQEAPTDAELRRLMESFRDEEISDGAFAYRRPYLGFEEQPWGASWSRSPTTIPDDFHVAVIGAGFSGVAMGVQLARLGLPYTIYERRNEPGGTWSINTYPGCRVDTTNFVYQYSFVKNHPWSEHYATQPEVRSYIDEVAHRYGITDNIRFNHDVERAEFDDATSTWVLHVRDGSGSHVSVRANVVVSAAGLFATPRVPDIDGIESFEGPIVHTARWNEDVQLRGKNVAIVGNGSSGVQVLKAVAAEARQVYVLQRTPQWISPRENYGKPISEHLRWLLDTMPYYSNWHGYSMLVTGLTLQDLHERDPAYERETGGSINARNDSFRQSLIRYIAAQVDGRRDLIDQLVPDYPPVARRLVVDNDWYKSLLLDHVELVTGSIDRITPRGIRTQDGVTRDVDIIVAATGFSTTKYLHPTKYVGACGTALEQVWSGERGGPRAYLGIAVPRFPNLFMMYGPNSQIRAGSLISWFEIWSRYIAEGIVAMIEGGHRTLDVREDVFAAYNRELDARVGELVWLDESAKSRNYYVNEYGRVQVNTPWRAEEWYDFFEKFDLGDYEVG